MIKKLITILLLAFCLPSHALELLPKMGLHGPASLSGQISYLQDASGKLTIEEASSSDKAGEFVALPGFLGKGFTHDTYWLRFTLQRTPNAPKSWFLEVEPPHLDELTLFSPQGNGKFDPTHLGDHKPYIERQIPHRNFIFPITLTNSHPVTYYIRIKTTSSMRVRIAAWQSTGLLADTQANTSLYCIYFGISLLGFFANLAFWLWLREHIYVYYSAYLASLTLLVMCSGGFVPQWLFPDAPIIADRLVGISMSIVYLTGVGFFIYVFNLRKHFPNLNQVFNAVLVLFTICVFSAFAGYYYMVAQWQLIIVMVVTSGLAIAGPWLLWHGHREYLLYTLAFSASYFSIISTNANLAGWLPTNLPIDYSLMLGSSIHIVLLYFAVAERVLIIERAKNTAEKLSAEISAKFEMFKQQRQFISMISHEIRTPLSIIQTATQSIGLTCSQTLCTHYQSTAKQQYMIRRAIIRVMSLLDNYLTGERLELYDGKMKYETTDLRDLANAAATTWQSLLTPPDRLQLLSCKKAVPINADCSLIVLVISNLIDNAKKYSPPGSPIKLHVGTTDSSGWVEVEDFGSGIPEEEIHTIFEKFYRSSNAQNIPGAGLGLHLVNSIIKKHDGKIEVHSEIGKGSRFRLYIPLRKEP